MQSVDTTAITTITKWHDDIVGSWNETESVHCLTFVQLCLTFYNCNTRVLV